MKLAFFCGDPDTQEFSVVEVDADTIDEGWLKGFCEMEALGWSEETKMIFLGHSV